MHAILSFCNSKQYEDDERGVSLIVNIPDGKLVSLLSIFEAFIDDPTHFHCRLVNDRNNPVYVIIDLIQ